MKITPPNSLDEIPKQLGIHRDHFHLGTILNFDFPFLIKILIGCKNYIPYLMDFFIEFHELFYRYTCQIQENMHS